MNRHENDESKALIGFYRINYICNFIRKIRI